MESKFRKNLERDFDNNCKGKKQCKISFEYDDFNKECLEEIYERAKYSKYNNLEKHMEEKGIGHDDLLEVHGYNKAITEPEFFVITNCKNIEINLWGTDKKMSKDKVAYIVTTIDFVSVVIFLVFINILQMIQKDFVKEFDQETIEIRDFTVKLDALPESFKKEKPDLQIYRFLLWKQIQ